MTIAQYMNQLSATYALVTVLSEKNDCRVLRMRNKDRQKDLVVRQFPKPVAAYEELCHVSCTALPQVYDVIPLEDGQIVLEEYIDGVTVAQVMEGGRYHYYGARKILRAVCHALSVLHSRQLVHRDVKPENILVDKNGRVVLIDFNASRRVHPTTKDTVVLGTVGYASPEQLGLTQSDARTDIYAAGVLLNVMLTGQHPSTKMAAGRAGRVVRRCTEISPDRRYQTAKSLAAAL